MNEYDESAKGLLRTNPEDQVEGLIELYDKGI
jgi:hypothetical protein